MYQNLNAALDSLYPRFDRNAALVGGFGLLALCWGLAFALDNDLCIIAAALCALFCMHVANKAQAWRDARVAANLGIYQDGQLVIRVIPQGEDYECRATVHVPGTGTWEYPNVGQTIPHTVAESCRCYFKPGIAWPVLIVSDHDCLIAQSTPRSIADPAPYFQAAAQAY